MDIFVLFFICYLVVMIHSVSYIHNLKAGPIQMQRLGVGQVSTGSAATPSRLI